MTILGDDSYDSYVTLLNGNKRNNNYFLTRDLLERFFATGKLQNFVYFSWIQNSFILLEFRLKILAIFWDFHVERYKISWFFLKVHLFFFTILCEKVLRFWISKVVKFFWRFWYFSRCFCEKVEIFLKILLILAFLFFF